MPDHPRLDRRSLLKHAGVASTALLAAPTASASSEAYAFESHLPADHTGPFAADYRFHFPEDTTVEYTLELATTRADDEPYAALVVYDWYSPGFTLLDGGSVGEALYLCEPGVRTCDGEVEREEVGESFRRSLEFSVLGGTTMGGTVLIPHASAETEGSDSDHQYPFRVRLACDAPISAAVEAGTTVHAFDQYTFEGGAAAATRSGDNTPAPADGTTEADVMVDQHLTADVPEERARLGLVTDGSVSPDGAPYDPSAPQHTRFSIDHPGGSETWTIVDDYDVRTLVGDGGAYRLGLNRTQVAHDPIFGGFVAGLEEVEDVRDAI